MKLGNNPSRKLTRLRGVLARYPAEPPLKHVVGADQEERRAVITARWQAEKDRLIALCEQSDEFARGIKTKKDHSSRAKIGRNV